MTYESPSNINASLGLGEVLNYVNTVSDNWFIHLVLLGIYIIILIGFYKAKEDFKGALAVAGFGTFVITLLFWLGGFANGWALGIAIALSIVGVLVLLLDREG